MKCKPSFCAVLLLLAAASAGHCEDSLFSHTPINSVFVQPGANPSMERGRGAPTQPREGGEPAKRLAGAPDLAQLIGQAGLDAKAVSENVVSTKVQHESWSFPALVTTSDDKNQVILILLLSVLKDDQQVPADKLLELMNASRDHAPAFFAYSSKRKRVELYRTLDNQDISPDQLRGEIARLAEGAAQTQDLWKLEASAPSASPPAGQKPVAASRPQSAKPVATGGQSIKSSRPGSANSLVGRWSASRSKTEAFAMQLKADGTFVLVHVNQGKQTRSTGKFTLAGQSLTLAGSDGNKLAGDISPVSEQEFRFQPSGGKAGSLTFKKAG